MPESTEGPQVLYFRCPGQAVPRECSSKKLAAGEQALSDAARESLEEVLANLPDGKTVVMGGIIFTKDFIAGTLDADRKNRSAIAPNS